MTRPIAEFKCDLCEDSFDTISKYENHDHFISFRQTIKEIQDYLWGQLVREGESYRVKGGMKIEDWEVVPIKEIVKVIRNISKIGDLYLDININGFKGKKKKNDKAR